MLTLLFESFIYHPIIKWIHHLLGSYGIRSLPHLFFSGKNSNDKKQTTKTKQNKKKSKTKNKNKDTKHKPISYTANETKVKHWCESFFFFNWYLNFIKVPDLYVHTNNSSLIRGTTLAWSFYYKCLDIHRNILNVRHRTNELLFLFLFEIPFNHTNSQKLIL